MKIYKQFKSHFPKINAGKALVLFLLVGFMTLLPLQSAQAIIGIDVFSYFSSALEGGEELSQLSTQFVQVIFLLFVISGGFLAASAALLQWVINLPINIIGNPFVENGWAFCLGLANLFFIIMFVFVALSFILKQNTQDTKKTLVKLIWVALLVNFSLFLVAASCDIARFFYNTVLGKNTNLVLDSVMGLMGGTWGIIQKLASMLAIWRLAYFVPPLAVIKQAASVALIFSLAALPPIISWMIQILFNFIIGGLFAFYCFIFFCRIFVIWFLAVLSPLAFVSHVLPQTEEYWKEWTKYLSEWLFVGILLLFHLVLGLKLLPAALPAESLSLPVINYFTLEDSLIYYFAFIVYLAIGVFLAGRNLPSLLDALIKTGKGIGEKVYPFVRPMGKAYRNWVIGEEQARKARDERLSRRERVSMAESVFGGASRLITTPGRWGYRATGISPKASRSGDMKKAEKDIEKRFGDDYVGAAAAFNQLDPMGKAALVHRLQAIKGEKALSALKPEQLERGVMFLQDFEPDWIKDVAKHKPELIDKDLRNPRGVGNIVRKALVSKGEDDAYVNELIDMGIEEARAIRKAAMKAVIDKPDDILDYSDAILKDHDFHEAILLKSNYQQYIRKVGEKGGQQAINEIRKTYDSMLQDEKFGARFFEKNNRGILYNKSAAFRSIWPPVNEIGGYNIGGSLGKGKPPKMSVYVEIEKALHENPELKRIHKIDREIESLKQQIQKQKGLDTAALSDKITRNKEEIKQSLEKNSALENKWNHIKKLQAQLGRVPKDNKKIIKAKKAEPGTPH